MFQLSGPVEKEARKIIGSCDPEAFLMKCTEAVNLLGNCGDLEGWKGYLDLCSTGEGRYLTLPREVGTVLAVNLGGNPTLGRDQLFSFHLNGPGDCRRSCGFTWEDQGAWHPTYRDLTTPAQLFSYCNTPADNNIRLMVYGYDSSGNKLRREVTPGVWEDGYLVPVIYGGSIPEQNAPLVARITAVTKPATVGEIRLSAMDNAEFIPSLLAVYEPDETVPQFRRIKLGRSAAWARIFYRKANPTITSLHDRIPLMSMTAFFSAMRSMKSRLDYDNAGALAWEADAKRLEIEAQQTLEAPLMRPIQVNDRARLVHPADIEIR
jgi:hypothetical protein